MAEECPICFDKLNDVNISTTQCGHKFHFSCIIRALKSSNKCPICKAPLVDEEQPQTDVVVVPIYTSNFDSSSLTITSGITYNDNGVITSIYNEEYSGRRPSQHSPQEITSS